MACGGYQVDLRETAFFLWEQHRVEHAFLGKAPYESWTRKRVDALIDAAARFAGRLGAANQEGDREGCELLSDGTVRLPPSFLSLWEEYRRDWLILDGAATGGDMIPPIVLQPLLEMLLGANPSFMTYGGFTFPAAKLIAQNGTAQQKDLFLSKLCSYEWDACFCATERQAGSDVTAVRTLGQRLPDGNYLITGEKIYISAGMHQLTGNTIYFVLGRTDPTGQESFNLSCFLVPKYWIEADGTTLTPNNVECVKVERKMGLKACANTHLVFGRSGPTRAYALGNRENVGLLQLRPLMADARLGTGVFGLGVSSNAYLHSLNYARRRIQGRPFDRASDMRAPRVPIIEHLDVQRMLLEMKSKVDGCRALLGKLSGYATLVEVLSRSGRPQDPVLQRARKMIQFYTPIIKAYVSDQAWRICELAIQVHGGIGYISDLPIEQCARDVKILSIWEGTNYIQAQDLVREKLRFGRDSELMRHFTDDVRAFFDEESRYPELGAEFAQLRRHFDFVVETLALFAGYSGDGRMMAVSQYATRYLAMLAEVAVSWLLLESACVAAARLRAIAQDDADRAFYVGKIKVARFYLWNILPDVRMNAEIIRDVGHSLVEIAEAEFGYPDHDAQQSGRS